MKGGGPCAAQTVGGQVQPQRDADMTKDDLLDAMLHIQAIEGVLKRVAAERADARSEVETAQRALLTVRAVLIDAVGAQRDRGQKS